MPISSARRAPLVVSIAFLAAGCGGGSTHETGGATVGRAPEPLPPRPRAESAEPVEAPSEPAAPEAPTCPPGDVCATSLAGPFASIDAFCALVYAEPTEAQPPLRPELQCRLQEDGRLVAAAPPFLDARVVSVANQYGDAFSILAIRTAAGWFTSVSPAGARSLDSADGTSLVYTQPQSGGERTITDFVAPRVADVLPGGAPELSWDVWSLTYDTATDDVYGVSETLALCGIGPSGTPSCTELAVAAKDPRRRGSPRATLQVRYGRAPDVFRVAYRFDGGVIAPEVTGDLASYGASVPRGRLVFP